MEKNPTTMVVMAAAKLKAVAPAQYQEFVDAVRSLEKASIVDMVKSDHPHEIFRAQGGVKTLRTLRQNLQKCTELRATYERREPNAQR